MGCRIAISKMRLWAALCLANAAAYVQSAHEAFKSTWKFDYKLPRSEMMEQLEGFPSFNTLTHSKSSEEQEAHSSHVPQLPREEARKEGLKRRYAFPRHNYHALRTSRHHILHPSEFKGETQVLRCSQRAGVMEMGVVEVVLVGGQAGPMKGKIPGALG
eukprot:749597-Hanusia_phi.AAC.3